MRLGNIDLLLERAAEFDAEQEDFFHQARRAQSKPNAATAPRSIAAEDESLTSSSSSSSSATSPRAHSASSPAASSVALAAALRPLAAFVAELRDADAAADAERAKSEVPDVIFMSTIHAAKGLEFDHVFVVRFNEVLFLWAYLRSSDQFLLEIDSEFVSACCLRVSERRASCR